MISSTLPGNLATIDQKSRIKRKECAKVKATIISKRLRMIFFL